MAVMWEWATWGIITNPAVMGMAAGDQAIASDRLAAAHPDLAATLRLPFLADHAGVERPTVAVDADIDSKPRTRDWTRQANRAATLNL